MANALMIGASAKMGMDFRILSPKSLFPEEDLVSKCKILPKKMAGKLQ